MATSGASEGARDARVSLASLVAQYDASVRTPADAEVAAWRPVVELLEQLKARVRDLARLVYDRGTDEATLRERAVALTVLADELRAAHEVLHQRTAEQRTNMEDFLFAAVEMHLTGAHRLATDPRGAAGIDVPVPGGAVPAHALSPTQYSVL